jgi:conjugative relaxase-like TrwC/TraI family protein
MLRFSPAINAAQAEHYYKHEFSKGDYYTGEETIVASRWHGRAAAELGLKGPVRPETFARLLQGRAPGGEVLVPPRQGLNERRAAWDVTISPHKSVSLVALVGGDERVIEAHNRAVSKALTELERHATAKTHGGRENVTTANVVIATFQHETSRALDPQLHTHAVVMNLTNRHGEWRALQEQGMFKAQKLARCP